MSLACRSPHDPEAPEHSGCLGIGLISYQLRSSDRHPAPGATIRGGYKRNKLALMQSFLNRRQLFQAAAVATALGAAMPAEKKMRLGVITGLHKDPDATIKRVHDLGFPTCQLAIGVFDDDAAAKTREALAKYGVEPTSAVATGPPPEIYDFYKGPMTIGVVPRQYREVRIARIKQVSDFAKKVGIT